MSMIPPTRGPMGPFVLLLTLVLLVLLAVAPAVEAQALLGAERA